MFVWYRTPYCLSSRRPLADARGRLLPRLDNLKQVTDTLLLGAVLRAEDPGRLRAIKDSGAVLLLLLECRVLVRLGRGGGEVLLGNGRDLVSEQGRGGDDEALAGGLGDRKRRYGCVRDVAHVHRRPELEVGAEVVLACERGDPRVRAADGLVGAVLLGRAQDLIRQLVHS